MSYRFCLIIENNYLLVILTLLIPVFKGSPMTYNRFYYIFIFCQITLKYVILITLGDIVYFVYFVNFFFSIQVYRFGLSTRLSST